jgi:hypothetical protein
MSLLQKRVPNSVVTVVFLVAILGFCAAVYYQQKFFLEDDGFVLVTPGSLVATSTATASTGEAAQAAKVAEITNRKVSTTTWQTFSSFELGYSLAHPADVTSVDTGDPRSLTFVFPKTYFSTEMKDDVTVAIYAAATCEPVAMSNGPEGEIAENVMVHGINFVRNTQDDAAAGNRYHTVTYDVFRNKVCYRITFFVHGANGAGLYVSEPAEVKAMQAMHDAELGYVTRIFETMLSSFTFIDTPAGENEATHIQATTTPESNIIYFRTRSQ